MAAGMWTIDKISSSHLGQGLDDASAPGRKKARCRPKRNKERKILVDGGAGETTTVKVFPKYKTRSKRRHPLGNYSTVPVNDDQPVSEDETGGQERMHRTNHLFIADPDDESRTSLLNSFDGRSPASVGRSNSQHHHHQRSRDADQLLSNYYDAFHTNNRDVLLDISTISKGVEIKDVRNDLSSGVKDSFNDRQSNRSNNNISSSAEKDEFSNDAAGPIVSKQTNSDVEKISEMKKCANCCKGFLAFIFSTVGLTCLMIAYVILGGFIFSYLEAPHEQQINMEMEGIRRKHVQELWNLTESMNILHPENWSEKAQVILEEYTTVVYLFVKRKGWEWKDEDGQDLQWTFAGSLLYSITVVTTIGYGHITPKTNWGRVVTMLYAIVGIPLTLLTITNLGGFMATAFRFIYRNICCGLCCLCCPKTKKRHRRRNQGGNPSSAPSSPPPKYPASDQIFNDLSVVVHPLDNSTSGRQNVPLRQRLNQIFYTDDIKHVVVPIYVSLLLIVGYIAIGAMLFSIWEDWPLLIGCYFCFVTLSTIGFGDYVPGTSPDAWNSQEKLVLCALYLLIGLALLAMCFDLMVEQARNHCRALGKKLGLVEDKIVEDDH